MVKKSVLLVLFTLLTGCTSAQKEAVDFELRSYETFEMDNGLTVLLVEDNRLPSTSYKMLLGRGSSADPKGQAGAAKLVASLLNKGTKKHSAMEFATALGSLGADYSASVSKDYTVISADALSFHQDKLLDLFAESITEPTFSTSEIGRAKRQMLARYKRLADKPPQMASMMFEAFLYGAEHPYGQPTIGQARSIRTLKKKHIIQFYIQNYRPNNAILAAVGKLDDDIKQQIKQKFGDWEARKRDKHNIPEVTDNEGLDIQLVNKKSLAQAQIRIGHPGIRRKNPDYLKLKVANTILGGAFASRLVEDIRVDKGLTYSIRSQFDARETKGPFKIATFTRHKKVGESVKAVIESLKKFRNEGVSKKEVKEAKALMKGQFPRKLETAERFASNLMILRFYGVSDDYLKNYYDNLNSLDASDVNEAIKKYVHPERFKILVYAPRSKVFEQLEPIGNVKVKSYKEAL